MTETCFGTIEGIREDRRSGSSGRPRQHPDPRFENTVRIADAETGHHVGPNTVGEITIRNPALMPGYWRNDEQNRETLRDGWLYTGDLGWLDDDGFLYFVDRKKDIIRRRGENISSQEVENVIKANPDVLDCAVVAVPSDLGEDEVKAYVTPRPGRHGQSRGSRLLVRRALGLLQGAPLLGSTRRAASHSQPESAQGRAAPRTRGPHRGLLRPGGRRHQAALKQADPGTRFTSGKA